MGCCNYNNTYSLPINNQWFWIILIIAVLYFMNNGF